MTSPHSISLFVTNFLWKVVGFFPMIQKMHVVVRKPLRTPPFIARVLVAKYFLEIWKILGFIAWPPHMAAVIKENNGGEKHYSADPPISFRIYRKILDWVKKKILNLRNLINPSKFTIGFPIQKIKIFLIWWKS